MVKIELCQCVLIFLIVVGCMRIWYSQSRAGKNDLASGERTWRKKYKTKGRNSLFVVVMILCKPELSYSKG